MKRNEAIKRMELFYNGLPHEMSLKSKLELLLIFQEKCLNVINLEEGKINKNFIKTKQVFTNTELDDPWISPS